MIFFLAADIGLNIRMFINTSKELNKMFYEIANPNRLEDEIVLIRKFLMNGFLNKVEHDERFYIYDYKIRFNKDISQFNKTLNNFIIYLRKNYRNEKEMIKLYNFLLFLNIDRINIKKNGYTINRINHETGRLKQHKISYKEILERLINFEILHNTKRFNIIFNEEYYTEDILEDPYYNKFMT